MPNILRYDGTHPLLFEFNTNVEVMKGNSQHHVTIHQGINRVYALFTHVGTGISILSYSHREFKELKEQHSPLMDVDVFLFVTNDGLSLVKDLTI